MGIKFSSGMVEVVRRMGKSVRKAYVGAEGEKFSFSLQKSSPIHFLSRRKRDKGELPREKGEGEHA